MAIEFIVWADAAVNVAFTVISLFILFAFLKKFNGKIPVRKGNVLGVILMVLGLSFHIIGHLFAVFYSLAFPDSPIIHIIFAFKSLAVGIFILGTAALTHYTTKSKGNKMLVKMFAFIYSLLSIFDASFHGSKYFDENSFTGLFVNPVKVEQGLLGFQMASLVFIYIILFLQARRAIRRVAMVRYQLLAVTALGFVLVILVDLLMSLSIISLSNIYLILFLFFGLHVITVGSLYLLVILPKSFQMKVGIQQQMA